MPLVTKDKGYNSLGDPLLIIMTGFSCNNNCLLCSLRPQAKFNKDKNTGEIVKMLEDGRRNGYKRVEFTGGEPTTRPDILTLISQARKGGFSEIALSTNGRMFGYGRFLEEAVKKGLNRVTLTLYGSRPNIHDAISRTPDSFDQTVKGIKNILKNSSVAVSVNTVVCRFNHQNLPVIGKLLSSMGVKVWGLLDLIPFGNAETFYPELVVDIETLASSIKKLTKIVENFDQMEFFDFPICVLGQELLHHPRITIFDAKGRMDEFKQVGYHPKRFENKDDLYNDVHKNRINACATCLANRHCAGIWKEYLDIYGVKKTNIAIENIKHP